MSPFPRLRTLAILAVIFPTMPIKSASAGLSRRRRAAKSAFTYKREGHRHMDATIHGVRYREALGTLAPSSPEARIPQFASVAHQMPSCSPTLLAWISTKPIPPKI